MDQEHFEAHPVTPVQTGADDEQPWLTVSEAVLRCTERGLPRTPKTVRKWALRSAQNPDSSDLSVRREDIENGYRWLIEPASLDRKIAEELEFEARQGREPAGTGASVVAPPEPPNVAPALSEPELHPVEPVQTGADRGGHQREVEQLLREQLEQAQEEVAFLRGELKHRRTTDQALGDVIKALRLQAETSHARLEAGYHRPASHQVVIDREGAQDPQDTV
ncbi:MAG: hypothetical protein D6773_06865 [Alphaproteobacteria bacterium]|nr:MAG: hypothetical protein D6773_06865 [Alphaproteobacteria bacterium]